MKTTAVGEWGSGGVGEWEWGRMGAAAAVGSAGGWELAAPSYEAQADCVIW